MTDILEDITNRLMEMGFPPEQIANDPALHKIVVGWLHRPDSAIVICVEGNQWKGGVFQHPPLRKMINDYATAENI